MNTSVGRFGSPLVIPLLLGAALSLPAPAQATNPTGLNQLVATKTTRPVKVDGKLDDDVWAKAKSSGLFVESIAGKTAPIKTEAKVAWDDKFLYLAFHNEDDDVWSSLKERDDKLWTQEAVVVLIDANGNGKDYIEIQVNPNGAIYDSYLPSYRKAQNDWNSMMTVGVSVDGTLNNSSDQDNGWDVEIAIPWADTIGQSKSESTGHPKVGDTWRMNMFRINFPKGQSQQAVAWSATLEGDFHKLDRFGKVVFGDENGIASVSNPGPANAVVAPSLPSGATEPAASEKVAKPALLEGDANSETTTEDVTPTPASDETKPGSTAEKPTVTPTAPVASAKPATPVPCYAPHGDSAAFRTGLVLVGEKLKALKMTNEQKALVQDRISETISEDGLSLRPLVKPVAKAVFDKMQYDLLCKDARAEKLGRLFVLGSGVHLLLRGYSHPEGVPEDFQPADDVLGGGLLDCVSPSPYVVEVVLSTRPVDYTNFARFLANLTARSGDFKKLLQTVRVKCSDPNELEQNPAWAPPRDLLRQQRIGAYRRAVKRGRVPRKYRKVMMSDFEEDSGALTRALQTLVQKSARKATKLLHVAMLHPNADVAKNAARMLGRESLSGASIKHVVRLLSEATKPHGIAAQANEEFSNYVLQLMVMLRDSKGKGRRGIKGRAALFGKILAHEGCPWRQRAVAADALRRISDDEMGAYDELARFISSGWHFAWGTGAGDLPINRVYMAAFKSLDAAPARVKKRLYRKIALSRGPQGRSKQALIRLIRLGDSGFVPQVQKLMERECPVGSEETDMCRQDYMRAMGMFRGE